MTREEVLAEAVRLVGDLGTVRDYMCDCGPEWASRGDEGHDAALHERFIVDWADDPNVPVCHNLAELRTRQRC